MSASELLSTYATNSDLSVFHDKPQKLCVDVLTLANKLYYTADNVALSDYDFDRLKDFIATKYPSDPVLSKIGAPPTINRVTLPYYMGSMDKLKDNAALSKWCSTYKGPYIASAKLDGVSGLIKFSRNPKMYTRGDGTIGQDVSPLFKLINLGTPRDTNGLCVRGEFIMKKQTFERKYKPLGASNPRNFVSGIVNSKTPDPAKCADVDFICYEVLHPADLFQSEQFELLAEHGLNVVHHLPLERCHLTDTYLTQLLITSRSALEYEIDGIIVCDNSTYYPHCTSGNPVHAFAFKTAVGSQEEDVTVVDVIWTPSQDGYLKPRVRIEPVTIGGVVVEYATGFNAAFIRDSGIGPGAVVRLIRSGDVIPYITETIMPTEPKMPELDATMYKWTPSGIDIVLINPDDNDVVREKNITGFFASLGVDGLSSGNVRRLIDAGYDTIKKILAMKQADFLGVAGFKDKMAEKLYKNIREKMATATIQQLIVGSNLIGRGFGEKKISKIFKEYPNVLEERNVDRLAAIQGFSSKTAAEFIQNVPRFMAFLEECGVSGMVGVDGAGMAGEKSGMAGEQGLLSGVTVVMTGFRDKDMEAFIVASGGNIVGSVSKNVDVLIVKDHGETTAKTSKYVTAAKLGIKMLAADEFNKLYTVAPKAPTI